MKNIKTQKEIMQNWERKIEKPLVSICCITYNHEKFINECLDGFLMQKTDFPYEILIHDDASTDKTVEIIKEYENKYPDIIKPIYQLENQFTKGVTKPNYAFNYPRVKGKYIAFCEGDDFWFDPNKLQKQVGILENNPEYTICMHACKIFNDNMNIGRWHFNKRRVSINDCLSSVNTHPNTWVFKNGLGEPPAIDSLPMGDDPLEVYLLSKGPGYYIDEEMSAYRFHAGGVWSTLNLFSKNIQKHTFIMYVWNYYPSKRIKLFTKLLKSGFYFLYSMFVTSHQKQKESKNQLYYEKFKPYFRTFFKLMLILSPIYIIAEIPLFLIRKVKRVLRIKRTCGIDIVK